MATATYLVTVSGPDRVGVGAELFEAVSTLSAHGGKIYRKPAAVPLLKSH